MKKSIFIIFLFSMSTTYVSQLFAQYNHNENIMVVGHRGASRYAPENTVASAKLAWDQQAEAVEIDVHLSSDNQIVVIHDYNTKKTCGQNFTISETPLHILKRIGCGKLEG